MKELGDKPFVLVGVNSDEDRESLKQTLIDEDITWRSWWDDGRMDGPIHRNWQIAQRPSIHLLDANGVIRFENIAAEDVDQAIDTLIEELRGE